MWGSSRPLLPHLLALPASADDDGGMGDRDRHQDHIAEPARPPLSAAQAPEMAARPALRGGARRPGAGRAHAAESGHPLVNRAGRRTATRSSASPAQAYRRLDVARALAAIHGAVAVGTEASCVQDTGPTAAAAPTYGPVSACLMFASVSRRA